MKIPSLIALLLVLHAYPVAAANDTQSHRVNGKFAPDVQDVQDKAQEDVCDCCQKCQAARKPVQPGLQEEGPLKKNGCEDCCQRCGRPVQPSPEEIPPEIMDRRKQR